MLALSSCSFRVATFTLCSYVRGFPRSGVPLYPRIHCIGGCVDPGVSIDFEKILLLIPRTET
jgi:hypothetical protein